MAEKWRSSGSLPVASSLARLLLELAEVAGCFESAGKVELDGGVGGGDGMAPVTPAMVSVGGGQRSCDARRS